MRKSFSFLLFAASALLTGNIFAQSTTVGFENGDQLLYTNIAKTTPLTAGVAATGGDGAVIRLGYYSAGTNAGPFAGDFVTLAGFGATNTGAISGVTAMYPNITYQNIRIGDAPNNLDVPAGAFALTLNFALANQNTNKNLPAAGVPLVIQFYNNNTIASSTFYNAVSNVAWDWQAPSTTAQVLISLNDANLQWLGGAATAFYTSQPNVIPEPSTYALAMVGIVALVMFACRRSVAV